MDGDNNINTNQGGKKNIAMAVVAYILFFVPLLTDAKNDLFVKFHVKQGLVLFIGGIITYILGAIFRVILGSIGSILATLLYLGIFVLFIVGVINAVNSKEEKLPLIGKYADQFKF